MTDSFNFEIYYGIYGENVHFSCTLNYRLLVVFENSIYILQCMDLFRNKIDQNS